MCLLNVDGPRVGRSAVLYVGDGIIEPCGERLLGVRHGGDDDGPAFVEYLPYGAHHRCRAAPKHLQHLAWRERMSYINEIILSLLFSGDLNYSSMK